jgi:hypothetical protein
VSDFRYSRWHGGSLIYSKLWSWCVCSQHWNCGSSIITLCQESR